MLFKSTISECRYSHMSRGMRERLVVFGIAAVVIVLGVPHHGLLVGVCFIVAIAAAEAVLAWRKRRRRARRAHWRTSEIEANRRLYGGPRFR